MAIVQIDDEMAALRVELEALQERGRNATSFVERATVIRELAELLKDLEGSEWISKISKML